MKKLELTQMEEVNGGGAGITCGLAVLGAVGMGIAIAGATGGFGLLAWGGWIASGIATGGSLGACAYEATH